MKKLLASVLALVLLLGLSGCGETRSEENGEGLSVIATLFPAYDFARQIGGERVRVRLLVPPGAESHSFEPTARDLADIGECGLFIYNGGESEAWVQRLLEGQEQLPETLCMLDCVKLLEEEVKEGMQEVHEAEEEEEGPEYDEHVWTSPLNAAQICEAVCEKLCALDPAGENTYRSNLAAYQVKLYDLDRAFRQAVSEGRLHTLVFADRFPVRYFVEEYGLDYVAAFPGCADDTEPSARTVAYLIDRVREWRVKAVFTIEFSDGRMADVIAEETGCKKLLFHSCHNISARDFREGVTYLDLMEHNLASLKEALG